MAKLRPEQLDRLADQLLIKIRQPMGGKFKFTDLAKDLEVEPDDITAASRMLRGWGYELNQTDNDVRLLGLPDSLTSTELEWMLGSEIIGKRIFSYREVKSTNDIAGREAENGAEEGTVIVAEQQTEGRGRFGRTWYSPLGTGAYVSIILRPDFPPEKAPGLSLVTALALAEVVERYCPKEVSIKWPNDVLIDGRKTAGILTELSAEKGKINHVVVGVGININQTSADFPDELFDTATSIRSIHGNKIDRVDLVKRFLRVFEGEYKQYQESGSLAPLRSRIRKYSSLLGRQVEVNTGKKTLTGKAVDIDEDGQLVVEIDGKPKAFTSGEVSVGRIG